MPKQGRRFITVTMTDDLFQQLKLAVEHADEPITVWVRDAIKAKLNTKQQ